VSEAGGFLTCKGTSKVSWDEKGALKKECDGGTRGEDGKRNKQNDAGQADQQKVSIQHIKRLSRARSEDRKNRGEIEVGEDNSCSSVP